MLNLFDPDSFVIFLRIELLLEVTNTNTKLLKFWLILLNN